MRGKTNDVINAEQEMKEKATNTMTREYGNSPHSPPVKNKCYYLICR